MGKKKKRKKGRIHRHRSGNRTRRKFVEDTGTLAFVLEAGHRMVVLGKSLGTRTRTRHEG